MEKVPLIPRSPGGGQDAAALIREVFGDEIRRPALTLEEANTQLASCNDHEERNILLSIVRAYEKHSSFLEDISAVEKEMMKNVAVSYKEKQTRKRKQRDIFIEDPPHDVIKNFPFMKFSCLKPPPHKLIIEEYERAYNQKLEQANIGQDDLLRVPPSGTNILQMEKRESTENSSLLTIQSEQYENKNLVVFIALPESVVFRNFKPGNTYELSIKLKNVSAYNGRFEINQLTPGSRFSASCEFRGNMKRLVPAGLTATVKIYFDCNSMEILEEELKITVCNGKDVFVKITAWRKLPLLRTGCMINPVDNTISPKTFLYRTVDCGQCLVGDVSSLSITLHNEGSWGRFCFLEEEEWLLQSVKKISSQNWLHLSSFQLTPAIFFLDEDEHIEIEVYFAPKSDGFSVEKICVLCDSCTVLNLDILGDAVMLERKDIHFYEMKFLSWKLDEKVFKSVSSLPVRWKRIPKDEDEEYEMLRIHIRALRHKPKVKRILKIVNNSIVKLTYSWKWRISSALELSGDEGSFDNIMDVSPDKGYLLPHKSEECYLQFNFDAVNMEYFSIFLEFYVENIPVRCLHDASSYKIISYEDSSREFATVLFCELEVEIRYIQSSVRESFASFSTRSLTAGPMESTDSAKSLIKNVVSPCVSGDHDESSENTLSCSKTDSIVHYVETSKSLPTVSCEEGSEQTESETEFEELPDTEIVKLDQPSYNDLLIGVKCQAREPSVLRPCVPLYINIESHHRLQLCNRTWFPIKFDWGCPTGDHANALRVVFQPPNGIVQPASDFTITVCILPILRCNVEDCYIPCMTGRSYSVKFLQIQCVIEDFHVTFELPLGDTIVKLNKEHTTYIKIPWDIDSCFQMKEMFLAKSKAYEITKNHVLLCGFQDQSPVKYTQSKDNFSSKSSKIFNQIQETDIPQEIFPIKSDESILHGSSKNGLTSDTKLEEVLTAGEIILPVFEPKVKHRLAMAHVPHKMSLKPETSKQDEIQIRNMFEGLEGKYKKKFQLLKRSVDDLTSPDQMPLLYAENITEDSFIVIVPLEINTDKTDSTSTEHIMKMVSYLEEKSFMRNDKFQSKNMKEQSSHSLLNKNNSENFLCYNDDKSSIFTTDAYSTISISSFSDEKGNSLIDEPSTELFDEVGPVLPFLKSILKQSVPVPSIIKFLNTPWGKVVKKTFVIRNETPIRSSLNLKVRNYEQKLNNSKPNIIKDAKLKVYGINKDEWETRIKDGSGLVIVVEPNFSLLEPNDIVPVTVSVYGNTWGLYQDEIICNINGLSPFRITVVVEIVGQPATFILRPGIITEEPTLKFGTLAYRSNHKTRSIIVKNNSCICISIAWHIFTKEPPEFFEDGEDPFNLVCDLFTPFSRKQMMTAGIHATSDVPLDIRDSAIQLGIIPFEGTEHNKYFRATPKEVIIKPFGETKLKVMANPCICDSQRRYIALRAVLLGFTRVSEDDRFRQYMYQRAVGYELTPLRLNIEADVEIPLLSLETPTEDCNFEIYATDIMNKPFNIYEEGRVIRAKNYYTAEVTAVITVLGPFSISYINIKSPTEMNVAKKHRKNDLITVYNGETVEIYVQCMADKSCVDRCLMMLDEHINNNNNEEIIKTKIQKAVSFESFITVTQERVIKQVIPLQMTVIFPVLKVSTEILDFGTVYVNERKELPLTIVNYTKTTVEIEIIKKNEAPNFTVQPATGILYAASTGKNTMDLIVCFEPTQVNSLLTQDSLLITSKIPQDFVEVVLIASAVLDQKFKVHEC